MADVRSLLRNERTSRRIIHPHAAYTAAGLLTCTTCQLQLKSESLWDGHLRSAQHVARSLKLPNEPMNSSSQILSQSDQTANRVSNRTEMDGQSKKRKADTTEQSTTAKRLRSTKDAPVGFFDEENADEDSDSAVAPEPEEASLPNTGKANVEGQSLSTNPSALPSHSAPQIDESEWARFERDIATPPPAQIPALASAATITVAPLTAAEIAAQAREEASVQREKVEDEGEAEKEDASRRLEEEFEEMAGLEERVNMLRRRMERLRKKGEEDNGGDEEPEKEGDGKGDDALDADDDNSTSDSEDEADWGGWDNWRI